MGDVTLKMLESGKACNPDKIYSGLMGPCISIGIYDAKQKCGYMCHQPNPDWGAAMENFIREILKKSDKKDLRVCACGGAHNLKGDDGDRKFMATTRKYVEDLLKKNFNATQVTIFWAPLGSDTELILDTSNGQFQINKSHLSEDNRDEEEDF